MRFLILCTLVLLITLVYIDSTDGVSCECRCCTGGGCTLTWTGQTPVSTCSSCNTALCQSTYPSNCGINGMTNSYCVERNSGHTMFQSIYSIFIITMAGFSVLMYQQLKW